MTRDHTGERVVTITCKGCDRVTEHPRCMFRLLRHRSTEILCANCGSIALLKFFKEDKRATFTFAPSGQHTRSCSFRRKAVSV